jgi:endonuclease-3
MDGHSSEISVEAYQGTNFFYAGIQPDGFQVICEKAFCYVEPLLIVVEKGMKTLDAKLIPVLEEKYGPKWWPVQYPEEISKDPFKNLILTVLSQNTSEVNCIRAYKGLSARFEVKPEILAQAKETDIRETIRSGGLYNVKAKRIKEVSKAVLERFGGDIASILSLPKEEARKRLMELPGIGPKTADVLLTSRHGYGQVFVVDTHMDRIAKRLGLVKPDAKYEEIQEALRNFIPWDKGERVGGLFWLLAKYTCRAQNPKCYECPLTEICEYRNKTKQGQREGYRTL